MQRSEQNLLTIIEELPLGVGVVQKARIAFANRALAGLTGYTREELKKLPLSQILPEHDRQRSLERLTAAAPGVMVPPWEAQAIGKDGTPVAVELSGLNLDLDGEPSQLVFASNIADRKALQARLALVDRMASVGTLAAGVAHEINNPIAFVTMNLGFVSDELERLGQQYAEVGGELKEVMEALAEAREGCRRVRHIVRSLKSFSHAQGEWRSTVDVTEVVERCLRMTWNEIRHRARLVRAFEHLPPIEANEAQLAQVVLNLLTNAIQAIPEGNATQHEVEVSLSAQPDGISIAVRDTGSGIAPDVIPHIFDPFFTTKPVGSNAGLGLSIAHSLVTSLGGHIQVETEVGKGSKFTVFLPLETRRPQEAARSTSRRARILVVDDEPAIGQSVQRTLRSSYDVEIVTHGKRVLELVREGIRFDLILCDLMMPGVSGMDVYEQLSTLAPDQAHRMVFMTAGAFTPDAKEFFEQRTRWRIEKPCESSQLEETIAQALRSFGV